jgi:hypothetical protein
LGAAIRSPPFSRFSPPPCPPRRRQPDSPRRTDWEKSDCRNPVWPPQVAIHSGFADHDFALYGVGGRGIHRLRERLSNKRPLTRGKIGFLVRNQGTKAQNSAH